jgi:hypothetical protein
MVGRCWSRGQVAGHRVLDPFSTTALAGGVVPGLLLRGRGEILARSSSAGVDEQRLILVVEDDEATRAFLLDNLAADGFRVAGASGAGEGLRAIEVRQPSLVVLDLVFEGAAGSTCWIACGPPTAWPRALTRTCLWSSSPAAPGRPTGSAASPAELTIT